MVCPVLPVPLDDFVPRCESLTRAVISRWNGLYFDEVSKETFCAWAVSFGIFQLVENLGDADYLDIAVYAVVLYDSAFAEKSHPDVVNRFSTCVLSQVSFQFRDVVFKVFALVFAQYPQKFAADAVVSLVVNSVHLVFPFSPYGR